MGVRQLGALIVFVVAVSGCSGGDSDRADRTAASATSVVENPAGTTSGQGQQQTASPGSPTSAAPSPSPSDPNIPATVKSPGPRVVVQGVVEQGAGAEAGCLVLSGYELMADSALWHSVLVAGEPVQVTGYVDKGRISSCEQDKVLVVTDIRP